MTDKSFTQEIIEVVKTQFPELDVTVSLECNPFLVIHPDWDGFEDVRVSEENGGLLIEWGQFTHNHIDPPHSVYEDTIEVVDHFAQLLRDVVDDKVAFFGGSHMGGGGFYYVELGPRFKENRIYSKVDFSGFLWSGKKHNDA